MAMPSGATGRCWMVGPLLRLRTKTTMTQNMHSTQHAMITATSTTAEDPESSGAASSSSLAPVPPVPVAAPEPLLPAGVPDGASVLPPAMAVVVVVPPCAGVAGLLPVRSVGVATPAPPVEVGGAVTGSPPLSVQT